MAGSSRCLPNATTAWSTTRTRVPSAQAGRPGAGSMSTAGSPATSSRSSPPSPKTWSAVISTNSASPRTSPWTAASDAPLPSAHRSAYTTRTRPRPSRPTTVATSPASWPTTTRTRSSPAANKDRTARSTRLRPPSRSRTLEPPPVTEASRSDWPAASTTPTRGSRDRAGSGWTPSTRPGNEASGSAGSSGASGMRQLPCGNRRNAEGTVQGSPLNLAQARPTRTGQPATVAALLQADRGRQGSQDRPSNQQPQRCATSRGCRRPYDVITRGCRRPVCLGRRGGRWVGRGWLGQGCQQHPDLGVGVASVAAAQGAEVGQHALLRPAADRLWGHLEELGDLRCAQVPRLGCLGQRALPFLLSSPVSGRPYACWGRMPSSVLHRLAI